MAYRWSVLLIETASLVFFIEAFRRFFARQPGKAAELWCAFFYGLVLEELDIYFFRTYRYGDGFIMKVGNAPLAIAFLWSLILTSSMAISDRIRIPEFSRPFVDGLLALLIDIGVDAIAIRIGYWTWTIPLTEGWFGVPAGNLYAWMWVAFWYSFLTRFVRKLALKDPGRIAYQILVPVGAYILLFCTIVCLGLFLARAGWTRENQRLLVFYGHVLAFGLVTAAGLAGNKTTRISVDAPPEPVLLFARLSIHIFFLAALIVTGIGARQPGLAAVAVSAFAVELGLWFRLDPGKARVETSRAGRFQN